MKSPIQNVLARNSNGKIEYLCSRCFKPVEKDATVCPYCNAKLKDIRCPFCNFKGSIRDFLYDTCPKCGRKKIEKIKNKGYRENHFFLTNKLFWILFFILLFILFLIFFIIYIVYFI